MVINKNIKMAELILINYQLLPVLNRFGLRLGFGEKTVEQVCKLEEIDTVFFLEIVNTFNNENYLPENHLQNQSIDLIIDYLKKSHDFFIDVKLNSIEKMISEFVQKCSSTQVQKVALIKTFFDEYKKELIAHIYQENSVVYPYIILLEKTYISNSTDKNKNEIQNYNFSVSQYASEHSDVEEKLFDLKNIIIKYIPRTEQTDLCNHILFDLFELEKDLKNHQRIEEKVLIPKALIIETELGIKNYENINF